jgi:hypothetical protein
MPEFFDGGGDDMMTTPCLTAKGYERCSRGVSWGCVTLKCDTERKSLDLNGTIDHRVRHRDRATLCPQSPSHIHTIRACRPRRSTIRPLDYA